MNGRMKWIYTKRRNIFQELIRASGNLKGGRESGGGEGASEISTAASDSLSRNAPPTTNARVQQDQLNASLAEDASWRNGEIDVVPKTHPALVILRSRVSLERGTTATGRRCYQPTSRFHDGCVSSRTIAAPNPSRQNDQFSDLACARIYIARSSTSSGTAA